MFVLATPRPSQFAVRLVVLTVVLVALWTFAVTSLVPSTLRDLPTPISTPLPAPAPVVVGAPLAPCVDEDGPGPCFWDAAARGNHRGTSFVLDARGALTQIG